MIRIKLTDGTEVFGIAKIEIFFADDIYDVYLDAKKSEIDHFYIKFIEVVKIEEDFVGQ